MEQSMTFIKEALEEAAKMGELITCKNLSNEVILAIADEAMLTVTVDQDGDLKFLDGVRCYVSLRHASKDKISFFMHYQFKSDVSRTDRLECVNMINRDYMMVRAVVLDHRNILSLNYVMLIGNGITKKNFVVTLRRFSVIGVQATSDCAKGLLA